MNCAVTSIVGAAHFGPRHWVVLGSFVYAVVLEAVLVPPQVWRTVRDRSIAPSAAVSMMQAPCSLNALTIGVLRRAAAASGGYVFARRADEYLGHALFGLSTLVFWLTLYGVYDRRDAIATRGFDLSWAAFTFPSCSTAIAALQYANSPSDPAASGITGAPLIALRAYAFAVAACVAAVVVFVAAGCLGLTLRECWTRWRSHPSRRYWTAWSPTRRLPTPHHLDTPGRGPRGFGRLAPFDEAIMYRNN